jgi:hypothetical protein
MTLLETSGKHKACPDDFARPRGERPEVRPTSPRTLLLEEYIDMLKKTRGVGRWYWLRFLKSRLAGCVDGIVSLRERRRTVPRGCVLALLERGCTEPVHHCCFEHVPGLLPWRDHSVLFAVSGVEFRDGFMHAKNSFRSLCNAALEHWSPGHRAR